MEKHKTNNQAHMNKLRLQKATQEMRDDNKKRKENIQFNTYITNTNNANKSTHKT